MLNRLIKHYKQRYLLLLFATVMFLVGVIHYAILLYSQNQIIQHEALRVAEVVSDQALTSRSVFTAKVVDKLKQEGFESQHDFLAHKGFVPIPAQFLRFVGEEVFKRNNGLYSYALLSKWNLQKDQYPKDDFQYFAWKNLEKQDLPSPDQPINWKPVWRFETLKGERVLRYMKADPAASLRCVDCHNKMEKKPEIITIRQATNTPLGKQWKLHQLLGAIEVDIPVSAIDAIASTQADITLAIVLLTSLLGFTTTGWLAIRDIRKERSLAQYFEQEAKLDPLTQLGNRTLFNDRARSALIYAKANNSAVSFLFVDLDNFKSINDTYGHHVGDAVLQEIAKRLMHTLRESDLVVRQGGDEFLILVEDKTSTSSVVVAQKLVRLLSQPMTIDKHQLTITVSIGISAFPKHGYDLSVLIERADASMYEAKRLGRNTYVIWSEDIPSR